MPEEEPGFEFPGDIVHFNWPLLNFARGLKEQRSTKIVAIGSSSTAGEGNIASYPGRLETELRAKFPNRTIDVLNKGIGGEEARSL